jgi:hypothetical protein
MQPILQHFVLQRAGQNGQVPIERFRPAGMPQIVPD